MVTLLILDGYGIGKKNKYNAIYKHSKNVESLKKLFPSTTINASGTFVGLSENQMGNSETGHLNIGAGRVVYQSLTKIDNAVKDDSLKDNKELHNLISHTKKTGGTVHLLGLLSNGGVHSHINHIKYLLKVLNDEGVNIALHAFLDGRDVKFDSGADFLEEIQKFIEDNKINCEISTVIGRGYAMDRERRFDRVQLAYKLLTGEKEEKIRETDDVINKVKESYKSENYDEFMLPIRKIGAKVIKDGDAILSFNFRTDRMRELISAFGDVNFKEFERRQIENLFIATMTVYDKTFNFAHVLFPSEKIKNCLSELLSKYGKKQFKVTETTKYAHITFFFNGEIEPPYEGEERKLIESYNVKDFSVVPKMRAKEITEEAISAIKSKKYDFILINISNPDMLGHTGNLKATKKAIDFVDKCVLKIAKASLNAKGHLIITADHGNAELMVDENGNKVTSHTTNLVPLILVSEEYKNKKLNRGKLADIAPTILELLNIEKPSEMTGESLIKREKRQVLICPSTDPVLPELENYSQRLIDYTNEVCTYADMLHCDIMDGNFVPRKTYDYKILKEINANSTIPLDVHLMTKFSFKEVKNFISSGANIITLHIENFIKNNKICEKKLKKVANLIKSKDCLFGLSLKLSTNLEFILPFLPIVDLVLLMSIEPGKSGQKFIEDAYIRLEKLNGIRNQQNLNFLIEIDGGVNETNSEKLINLGADMLVSGSYVFKSENRKQAVENLRKH